MRSQRALATCLAFVLFVFHLAGADTAGTAVPKLPFEKYVLPNGLQVILHVDRKLPMVSVDCWYHVGSKNERVGRTGFAHLFEHMMFEGSKDANTKYFGFVEKAGANLFEGGVNGTTSEDRTNYFETVPSGSLEFVLWLESDRLATLTEVLTKEKLDNERDIVKNERRQGLENTPYGRAFQLISENTFPANHPYSHTVIGSHEDLTAATVDDVKEFFRAYYTPNNLSLTITGDFDIPAAKQLIEKYFGPIPPGPALDRPKRWVPELSAEKVFEIKDHVPQERVYLAWPSPAFFDPGDADLDLTSLILTDGLSSRLIKALVHDRQLCSDVVSFQNSEEIAGVFGLWATARPGAGLPEVEQAVDQEIARLAADGPTPEELTRAKNKWQLQYLTGLERIGGFGGQADLLNEYNTFLGDPGKLADDIGRHQAVTAESVKKVTAAWINTPNRVVLRFHPDQAVASATVATLDRSKEPELSTGAAFHAPQVEAATLDNGLKVFVVERHDLPKVSVMLATRAGSAEDPASKEGLSALTVEVMKRGTKHSQALEIDDKLGDLGTTLEADAQREVSALSMEVLTTNLAPATGILADVVRNPSFPGGEVEREKKKRVDALSQEESNPRMIARRLASVLAFGPENAYGHPVNGFTSAVEKLSTRDLEQFHADYWKPGSSALFFAGDITLAQATELGKQYFGSWTGGAAPAAQIAAPHPVGPGKIFLVDRPNAAQTYVEELLPAPVRQAADYYSFRLADVVWGGAASARLGMNLREKNGYSYGVFSFPQFYTKYGLWVASGGVQTNKTKESVVEFQKELHFLAGQQPVTKDELERARNFRIRGYSQQFESINSLESQMLQLWTLNLPMTELQREPEELAKASLDSVNATAEKYANPGQSMLLLVGDASKIEAGVRSLNLGEIVKIDAQGRPLGDKH